MGIINCSHQEFTKLNLLYQTVYGEIIPRDNMSDNKPHMCQTQCRQYELRVQMKAAFQIQLAEMQEKHVKELAAQKKQMEEKHTGEISVLKADYKKEKELRLRLEGSALSGAARRLLR